MIEAGEVEPVDCAIFADTKAEPAAVYRWLDWLEGQLSYPVHRVTAGDLALTQLSVRRSKKSGKDYVRTMIPAFVKKTGASGACSVGSVPATSKSTLSNGRSGSYGTGRTL